MIKNKTSFLNKFISLGADETTTANELKKIKLLHIFCLLWYFFLIFTIIEDVLRDQMIVSLHIIRFSFVVLIQVLQYYKLFLQARLLFIFEIILVTFFCSNFILPYQGVFVELFYLFPPTTALIFIDKKIINIIVLIISFLCYFIPNLFFEHYPINSFNNVNTFVSFFSVYIMVSYFKNLNIRNEKRLEIQTKELEELDKFKSQFFTNISHEIRTPLTLIQGGVTDIDVTDSEKTKQSKKNIFKQIHNITNMVDSVLDLAKMQTSNFNLELQEVNLSDILRKVYISFKPLFDKKKITFNLVCNSTDYFSNVDIVFFEKALNNLIVNALKYTDSGVVNIDVYDKDNRVIIKIKDTGIGIEEKDVDNVFKRFYQVNNDFNQAGGSGIGLAFCKEIVELHKGEIFLKSEPNKGSEFIISLPLSVNRTYISSVTNKIGLKELKDIRLENKLNSLPIQTFLIVEDDFDMSMYLRSILEDYHCLEASNGLEALEMIAKNKIDFIITDYMMPKLNGYELVVKLNAKNSNIPIIMLTSKTDLKTKLEVLKLGIDDYVTKPFDKDELLARVYNCLENNLEKSAYNKENDINKNVEKVDSFIVDLKTYIYKNSNNISLNQELLAEEFHISKSSFYRKIKSTTGLSPNKFILEIRLNKAREILENTPDIPLKKLSSDVGFKHTNYFSTVYTNRFGVKP